MAVQTVLGPVQRADLGQVLTHEHLFVGWAGWDLDPVAPDQKTAQYPTLIERLRAAWGQGVRTVVDASPAELGRDVELLARAAGDSGLNVIASTGFYHEAWGLPVYLKMRSAQEMSEMLLAELEQGIGPERIRAGAIKIASSGTAIGKHEQKALLAAAAASKATGAPILTHASGPEVALEQAQALVGEGVRPGAIQIGHCDAFEEGQLVAVLALGVIVAFDQVVYEQKVGLDHRVDSIMQLVRAGYGNCLTLSHDQLGIVGGREVSLSSTTRELTFVHRELLPRLRRAGLTPEQERRLTVLNPADWLCGPANVGSEQGA